MTPGGRTVVWRRTGFQELQQAPHVVKEARHCGSDMEAREGSRGDAWKEVEALANVPFHRSRQPTQYGIHFFSTTALRRVAAAC